MSGELQQSSKDRSDLDNFFSQFSWAFLNFTAQHHLRVDRYWHDFPSWRFSFRHPKGGVACIEIFRDEESQLSVSAYWWIDDYDEGKRSERTHRSAILPVASINMAELLEKTLTTLVAWPLNFWTEVTAGLGDYWKISFTKEQFELQIDQYPRLKPHSVQGM